VLTQADHGREVTGGQAAPLPGIEQQQALFGGQGGGLGVGRLNEPPAASATSGEAGHPRRTAMEEAWQRPVMLGYVSGHLVALGLIRHAVVV
jgi:hypothetical protein